MGLKLAAYDLETWAVDLQKYPTPPIVCASYQRDGQAPELVTGKQNAVVALLKLLKEGYTVAGANFCFDLACLLRAEPKILPKIYAALDEGRIASTDLLEQLHDNALGRLGKDVDGKPFIYSLANLERRYFGRDRSAEKKEGWRLRYHELDGVPLHDWPAEARSYPLADATGTLDLLRLQLTGVGAPEPRRNLACLAQEMRAAFALKMMSLRGIRTDKASVEKLAAEVETEFARSREKFLSVGFVEKRKPRGGKDPETPDGYDPCSECAGEGGVCYRCDRAGRVPFKYVSKKKPVQERVSAAYDGNPPLTDKGGVSCEKDTLLESGDPLLEEWGDASGGGKIRSTYIPVLRQGTEMPIHPTFRVLPLADSPGKYKSTTGRCSCTEPNLQNLPRGTAVREAFVPRPGHLLCSVDYSALEMATLAQVCFTLFGHSNLRDSINAGEDQHVRLAARARGLEYEAGLALKKAKDKEFLHLRQAIKPVNFGLPGLMGPPKLVLSGRKQGVRFCEAAGELEECGSKGKVHEYWDRTITPTCAVCLELAIQYRRLFFEEWPEVKEYHQWAKALIASGEPLVSLSAGSMERMEDQAGAGSNHFFQNLAAVLAKDAAQTVTRAFLDSKYRDTVGSLDPEGVLCGRGGALLFIHDEVLSELREEFADSCARKKSEIMVAVGKKHVPDVLIAAPPALARAWHKNMEAVTDEKGRLIPWEPKAA